MVVMRSNDPLAEAGLVVPAAEGGHDGGATAPALVRIKVLLAYDGAEFSGWATQPGRITVQGRLEEGLELLVRRRVRTTVAGRTDAGVHARGQVAHFDLTEEEVAGLSRGRDIDPMRSLLRRLRGVLTRHGQAILIRSVEVAPAGFDARFSALWRRYSYRIADGPDRWDPLERRTTLWHADPVDLVAMNAGVAALLGQHDFLSFCKPRERATTIRTLTDCRFERGADGVITAHLRADAFCHNMVRAVIGAALRVGDGREAAGWIAERLDARVRDAKSILAAPHPLVLEEVAYPDEAAELAARAELTRARRAPADAGGSPGTSGG